MRLNRVLQNLAAASIAAAAMIFTISCSGEDGADGKAGPTCTVQNSAGGSGYDVICGGAKMGTLDSGGPGTDGTDGAPGATGPQGDVCQLNKQGGSYQIICGGALQGTLDACFEKIINENEASISCGSTEFSVCSYASSIVVFNPSEKFCKGGSSGTGPIAFEYYCGKDSLVAFNHTTKYCGYATPAAREANTPTVLDSCPTSGTTGKINPALVGDSTSFTATIRNDKIYGAGTVNPWDSKYCQATLTRFDAAAVPSAGDTTFSLSAAVFCDGDSIKPNEWAWKGEYCGFKDAAALTKTLLSNACGDGKGPDRDAFGKEYCQMAKKTDKRTQSVATFCDVGTAPATVRTSLNKVDKNTLLDSTDWKNEYCGYEDAAAIIAGTKVVKKGVCDDGLGPNDESIGTWQNQYCQVPFANKTTKLTKRVGGAANYCIPNASTAFRTAGPESRVNEGTWQNQYCGYESKADFDALEPSIQTGVCDDGSGPNANSWANEYCQASKNGTTAVASGIGKFCGIASLATTKDYTGSLNKDGWKDEYCGYAKKEDVDSSTSAVKKLSVLKGTCDYLANGTTLTSLGPNNSEGTTTGATGTGWKNEYCQGKGKASGDSTKIVGWQASTAFLAATEVYCLADTTGRPYATAGSEARLNEGGWKDEYCGFASKNDFDSKTFSILSGTCNLPANGNAPNKVTSTYTAWTNDYCQVQEANALLAQTTKVSGTANNGKNIYCTESGGADFATADSDARLNEGTWKGEFCFADNVKGMCPGGQTIVAATTLSTATPRCKFK